MPRTSTPINERIASYVQGLERALQEKDDRAVELNRRWLLAELRGKAENIGSWVGVPAFFVTSCGMAFLFPTDARVGGEAFWLFATASGLGVGLLAGRTARNAALDRLLKRYEALLPPLQTH
jgi:hypothetical protein